MSDFDPDLLLAKRFPKSHWHMAYEVASHGGGRMSGGSRWADCIAIGRASGDTEHTIHGIEVKRSRVDVLNEIRKPEKSAPFLGICKYWWMLCPPNAIDLALKLPPEWGVATQSENEKFKIVRPAPHNGEACITPVFVYSLLSATLRERHDDLRELRTSEMIWKIANDTDLFVRTQEIRDRVEAREDELARRMWE
jgi:hypothetical protein